MSAKTETECIKLIEIIFRITDANTGKPASERDILAESILMKFVNHATSTIYLLRQTRIQELSTSYIDITSINVLTRAALETVYVFAYLFDLPTNNSVREFRGDAWMLYDLLARQEFGAPPEKFATAHERERQRIDLLTNRLKANPLFPSLSKKEQTAYLTGKKWRSIGWSQIGIKMGLDPKTAFSFYSFLCSHSHTGYMSVLQVNQAKSDELTRPLVSIQSGFIAIAAAHIITMYTRAVPSSMEELTKVPSDGELIKMWKHIGTAKLMEN